MIKPEKQFYLFGMGHREKTVYMDGKLTTVMENSVLYSWDVVKEEFCFDEGRYYPNPLFWEVAAEEGNPVVIGMDAHIPAHVARIDAEKKALQMVQALSLELIEMPEIVRI